MNREKVVLAYSGGLDTSIIIPWLMENYDYDVIAVCVDIGQGKEVEEVKEKALKTGAVKVYIEECQEEFASEYIYPTLKAGAIYQGKYLLGTSFARPIIAKKLVQVAEKEGAVAIAHGATGKGNDQVRFELSIKALNPFLKIIAPWREWDIKSREDAIEYANARNIPVPVTKDRPYSMDRNLWHLSHEGGDLENPWNESKDDLLMMVNPINKTPDTPLYIEIGFEKGVPITLDGKALSPVKLIDELNQLGGLHGIGVMDMVEDRLVGMKSRGVYECPGGTILYSAHQILEQITLDRETYYFKEIVSSKYAKLVYDGLWFSPLKEALDQFVNKTQESVTGVVRLKLFKGNCKSGGVKSPNSIYNEKFATFENDGIYNHKDAQGFINLFGLPITIQAMMKKSQG